MGDLGRLRARVVVGGTAVGIALVTDAPLSFWGGLDPGTGEIVDRHHPLSGEVVTGRILALPHGRGSCSSSGVLLEAIRNGTGPAAIITSRIDPIIGLGAILADEIYGRSPPVLVLDPGDFDRLTTGQTIDVTPDGAVLVRGATQEA